MCARLPVKRAAPQAGPVTGFRRRHAAGEAGPVILIGIGSNLAAAGFASPLETAAAGVALLSRPGSRSGAAPGGICRSRCRPPISRGT